MFALCGVRWMGCIVGTGEVAGDEAQIDAFEQPVASQAVEFGGSEPEPRRSEEHTSELQSLMRSSYAVLCLTKTAISSYTPTVAPYNSRRKGASYLSKTN